MRERGEVVAMANGEGKKERRWPPPPLRRDPHRPRDPSAAKPPIRALPNLPRNKLAPSSPVRPGVTSLEPVVHAFHCAAFQARVRCSPYSEGFRRSPTGLQFTYHLSLHDELLPCFLDTTSGGPRGNGLARRRKRWLMQPSYPEDFCCCT